LSARLPFLPLVLSAWLLASGCSSTPPAENPARAAERAVEHALAMVGKPYRYGGSSPAGFDCSGLVHYSYGRAGVRLPRSTEGLRRASRPVSAKGLQRGDLLFFDQEGKKSSHVAIYIGGDRFVHAPSTGKQVHVASFADRYWQRHFSDARRPEVD